MNFIKEHFWLVVLIIWGFPMSYYRSKFRKLVYQTESWLINIKPVFLKELKALFGNPYPDNKNFLKFRNFYRFYLSVYLVLFVVYYFIK